MNSYMQGKKLNFGDLIRLGMLGRAFDHAYRNSYIYISASKVK